MGKAAKKPSREEKLLRVMGIFMTNCRLDHISDADLNEMLQHPREVGEELSSFINGLRFLPQLRETITFDHSDRFSVDELFKEDTSRDSLNIGSVQPEFYDHFGGRVEEPRSAFGVEVYWLPRVAHHKGVMEKLGGGSETTFAHIRALLKNSEERPGSRTSLLCPIRRRLEFHRSIFYMLDNKGKRRPIVFFWDMCRQYWHLMLHNPDHPNPLCRRDDRVLVAKEPEV